MSALRVQGLEHRGNPALIVLEIRIHDDQRRRRARQHSLNAGRREAAAPDPADASYPAVSNGYGFDLGARPIRGVIVYEDHLPAETMKRSLDARDEFFDVLPFIERGHDDGQVERNGVLLTAHGSRPRIALCRDRRRSLCHGRASRSCSHVSLRVRRVVRRGRARQSSGDLTVAGGYCS
jgi:hypothetical protein